MQLLITSTCHPIKYSDWKFEIRLCLAVWYDYLRSIIIMYILAGRPDKQHHK